MGVVSSHKELIVATVNYSGILFSPYEFYSQESFEEEEKVSKCFKKLLEDTHMNFDVKTFKWGLGKIDQKVQKQRYAVVYRENAGVENNKLVNETQFRKRWQQEFAKAKKAVKFQSTPEEQKGAEDYDLHCYRTFIYYLYNEKDLQKVPQLNPNKYIAFQKSYFSKSFLNEKQKITQTFDAMQKQDVDVFFFQQSNEQFQKQLQKRNEFICFKTHNSTSLTVLRKRKFTKFHNTEKLLSNMNPQFAKGLNLNEDSTICFVDNFIFYNVHLSSKKQKNPDQLKQLSHNIQKLRQMYPMCQIIAGGDINTFLSPQNFPKQISVFPPSSQNFTTMKKRTWLQPQVNKADQLSHQCKDSLISTLPMVKSRIVTILGVDYKKIRFIPNQEHPCDHFVVTANIVAHE